MCRGATSPASPEARDVTGSGYRLFGTLVITGLAMRTLGSSHTENIVKRIFNAEYPCEYLHFANWAWIFATFVMELRSQMPILCLSIQISTLHYNIPPYSGFLVWLNGSLLQLQLNASGKHCADFRDVTLDGWTPLHPTARHRGMDISKLLDYYGHGADENSKTTGGETALPIVSGEGNLEIA